VLLLTASVGSGHCRAAQAVATALCERAAQRRLALPVRVVDLLAVSPRLVSLVCRDAYVGLVQRSPRLVGWLYRRFDRPSSAGLRGRLLWSALARARRLIEQSRPDAIVSSHFLASELVARMKRGGMDIALETVVTDVDAHGMWIWPETDRYFVASPTGAATLARSGVPCERIVESGIPIDPAFERLPPRAWARRALGLDGDRPVVLFSTGGAFVGPVESCVRALARLRTPVEIVVICGRAERARCRLQALAGTLALAPGVALRIEGFTDRMQVWMAAADLFVGKPGGLSSAECRASSLPMVIASVIPGQEERNADALVRDGAAVRLTALGELTATVEHLLSRAGTASLASMRRCAAAAARPDAARRVADAVIDRLLRRSLASRLRDAPPLPRESRRAG